MPRDHHLFARIATGDTIAYRDLFDLYFQPLYLKVTNRLKSEYWAEEIAQETLLQVWESRNILCEVENPRAWLYRVAANRCLDKVRRHDVENKARYLIKNADYDKGTVDPVESHDFNLLSKLLDRALQLLTEQQRTVYFLQQEEGLSYKEIGQRMGISPHTVRNHLIKAFGTVRDYVFNHF